ncbi:lipopolysaccharide biosynthesis protein [Crateriforma conspicua]|uniref:lipopolysaccharide biosynthesis protein n=1 Tax=Crateriforma conspicua TaxID=2527996 RepID=UPI0011A51CEC|nr:hypothetical protein [Crateriforma conspicua]
MRTGFQWTFIGNSVYAASQWGILAVLNKVGSTEAAGLFLLAHAIVSPAALFFNFNFRVVWVTDAAANIRFGEFVCARLVYSVLLLVFVVAIGLIMPDANTSIVLSLVAMGIAAAGLSISDLFCGLFQKQERLDLSARTTMFRGILNFGSFACTFCSTRNVVASIAAMGIARIFLVLFHDLPLANSLFGQQRTWRPNPEFGLKFSWESTRTLTCIGLPLGINAIAGSLTPQIPRLILNYQNGLEALGVFGSISQVIAIGSMVITALGTVFMPRLSKAHQKGDVKQFVYLTFWSIAVAIAIGTTAVCVSSLIGERLLRLLYTPEYSQYQSVLVICMLAATGSFAGCICGMIIASARRFSLVLVASLSQCSMALIAALLFIPRFGLHGAAYSLVVSNIIMCILYAVFLASVVRDLRHAAVS